MDPLCVTRETLLSELLDHDPDGGVAEILTAQGMHCLGCPSARAESLQDACLVHGIDPDLLLAALRDYLGRISD